MHNEPDPRREIWSADVEVTPIEVVGREWPDIILTLFQRNRLGERRYVGTQSLHPGPDGKYCR
jgi:hypothetical protein